MPEFAFHESEAWNTAVRLTASVGRLRIASNLKAAGDAQANAFTSAGNAAAFIAEATALEGAAAAEAYRDARAALARTRSWLAVLAAVTNEPESVFADEFGLVDLAGRQVSAVLRTMDRGGGPGPRLPRPGPPPGQGGGRPPGPFRGPR